MKICVLDKATLAFPDSEWAAIAALGEFVSHELTPTDEAVITDRCRGATVVLTNKVPLSARVMEQLPQLKLISTLATGYNLIDTAAAARLSIAVSNVAAYSTEAVAQHTIALLLAIVNRVEQHDASVKAGEWTRSPVFSYWLHELRDLCDMQLGLVGFGTIGRRVAAIASALGMRVAAHTRTRRDAPDYPGFAWMDLPELFATSDVVSLHCPATPENTGFVNAPLLSTMKPGAILINTARGTLIHEADLAAELAQGRIYAALDVLSKEPPPATNPLLSAPNCLITPHCAWASAASRRRLLSETVLNIKAFTAGEKRNRVE